MNNFQNILENVLNEKKSVTTALNSKEVKELVGVFKSSQPDISLQQMDMTDMFDKTLQHLLGGRDTSVIPGRMTEAGWMIHQLEFDNKFMGLVRKAK